MRDLVLVTGVTGFLGGHVAEELLGAGYDVRGTARDPEHADVGRLLNAADEHGGRFELVAASLTADAGWDAAVEGVKAVAHVASPAPKQPPDNEEELIRPAVDGTQRVLAAAARAGARVAVTSSIDAVRSGHDLRGGQVLDEETWSIVERCEPYAKSKTLAERAAWAYAEELGIELTTLLPGLVLGPVQRCETNVSVDLIRQLMTHELPALPRLGFTVVDARDVATAHRLPAAMSDSAAFTIESRVGRAAQSSSATDSIWPADIARILDEAFASKETAAGMSSRGRASRSVGFRRAPRRTIGLGNFRRGMRYPGVVLGHVRG
jgi:dihydroflavonol-4-reductase